MKRARSSILAVAFLAIFTTSARTQTSGLSNRQPIGAYLNNVFPSTSPNSGGGYVIEDAFPGVTFSDPIQMVQEPNSSRVWVITRQGQIWRLDRNAPATTKTLMVDLGSNTLGGGDSGLLGIALHPQFGQASSANCGYLYVWYNYIPNSDGGSHFSYNRLSRLTLADNASSIARSSELVMINQFDEQEWHNGGGMYFGPDSFLYLTVGDEGHLGDPFNNSQKINGGFFSGVLRIDVNSDATRSHPIRRQPSAGGTPPAGWPATYSQGYFIPNDNPWNDPSGSVLEEFFAIGLRSPHRMTFDSASGKTYIGDVGEDEAEEVNVLTKSANYQWAYREGTLAGPKSKPATVTGQETAPIYSYPHTNSNSCIIGGHIYRGSRLAGSLFGKYIFGDYISGRIWSLDIETPGAQPVQLAQVGGSSLACISVDSDNELYFSTLGGNGKLMKLTPSGGTAQPPATLSATNAFSSLASLTPAPGIVPFNVNAPLWSDGAEKKRWIALPNDGAPYSGSEIITFSATGNWGYPVGTVLIKHFELGTNDANPAIRKRLETRFFVRATDGWYGVTYKWRADGSDADLLAGGENMSVTITTSGGGTRTQNWTFPSRGDCLTCHTQSAGVVLGPNTRQLNGNLTYPTTGITANQLATWSAIGMFDIPLSASQISGFTKMAPLTDATASLETRVRSYLDSNCAHCHRPGGVRANWDGRFDTPMAQANIINGPLFNEFGIAGAKEVVPQDTSRSMMHIRTSSLADIKMPPLAKNVVDASAVSVIAQWINSLSSGTQPTLTGADVGNVGAAGSTTGSGASGSYTLNGSGSGIYGTADAFQFAWATLTGDGEIRARVTSQTNTNPWAKAGVMVRESSAAGSRHATTFLTPVNGFGYEFRPATDQPSEFFFGPASNSAPNNWVRLARVGNVVTGYTSADGQNWTLVNAGTMPALQSTLQIGLIVTSSNFGVLSTATFDNVQITGANQPPGAPATPTGLAASAQSNSSILLTWTDVATNETGYRIERATGAGAFSEIASLAAGSSSFTNTSLAASTLYNYKVSAFNTGGSGTAGPVSATTFSTGGTTLAGADIGAVGVAGSTVLANGIYTVKGSGSDIYYTADSFQFAYTSISGDGEIIARVTSQTNTASWAKAGVMMRESLSVGSRHGTMFIAPFETQNGYEMLKRTTTNGSTTYISGPGNNAPPNNWLRLVRAGDTITGYASANGTTWTLVHAATYTSLPSSLYFGLAVTSVNNSVLGTATFDNVQITGTNQPPAVPAAPTGLAATAQSSSSILLTWTDVATNETGYRIERATGAGAFSEIASLAAGSASFTDTGLAASTLYNYKVSAFNTGGSGTSGPVSATTFANGGTTLAGADIGAVGVAGSTTLANGVYTVKGSGSDIYYTADSFQFAYTSITGDGEIIARVTSQTNTASWAKAGVMMRESLSVGSRHGTMFIAPFETQNGYEMLKRTTTNGSTTYISGPGNNAPPNNWLRLVRAGDTITGYASANGTTWTLVHAASYTSLPASLYFGLAVTSVNNSVLGTATFDNVQINGTNQPPSVPATPTGLAATTQSSSSIRLTWTDVATNETGYRIERATGAGSYAVITTLAAGSASFTDTSLAASTLYNYKVSAFNTGGSGTAGPVSATTFATGGTLLVGADIGAVGVAGSTVLANGVYTVKGSGADIYYTSDSFHYASTSITGDGEIKARVTSQTNTAAWAKAGVMIRESRALGSRHATMYITPYEIRKGFEYLSRSATNGSTVDVGGPANNPPPDNWVRLVRVGNTITGYASANGTSWSLVHSVTFTALPANLMFGLAVTSVDNSVLGTATFDNVQVTGAPGAALATGATANLTPLTAPELFSAQNASGSLGVSFTRASESSVRHELHLLDVLSQSPAGWRVATTLPVVTSNGDGTENVSYPDITTLFAGADKGFARLHVEVDADGDGFADSEQNGEVFGFTRASYPVGTATAGSPFAAPTLGTGVISAAGAGSITLDREIPSFGGASCYLEVTRGANEGARIEIDEDASSGGTLVIEAGAARSTLAAMPASLVGDSIAIRPHRTVSELFLETVFQGASSKNNADRLLFYNGAAFEMLWLWKRANGHQQWVRDGDASLANAGSRIIDVSEGVLVQTRSTPATITLSGIVRENAIALPLKSGTRLLANPWPAAMSPNAFGMTAANSFTGSRSSSSADQIQIWKGDAASGSSGYAAHYLLSSGPLQQWVLIGDASLADLNDALLFSTMRAAFIKCVSDKPAFTVPLTWQP